MSYAMLRTIQRYVLFAIILALPLTGIPQRYSIPGMGRNLAYYLAYIGIALLIYEYLKYKFEINKRALTFIYLFIGWEIICFLHGMFFYEFNHLLTLDQLPRMKLVVEWFAKCGLILEELTWVRLFLGLRAIKQIFIVDSLVFLLCFYIYHLYKDNFKEAFKDVFRAIIYLTQIAIIS